DPSAEGLLRRVERLEKGIGTESAVGPVAAGDPPSPAVAKASSETGPPTGPPAEATAPEDDSEPPDPAEAGPAEGTEARGAEAAMSLEELVRLWPAVLDNLRQNAPALAATFEGARPVGIEEGGVRIGFPAEFTFNKRKAEAPEKRDVVAGAIEAV